MGYYEFSQLFGEREILRLYGQEELREDFNFAVSS